jgi:hypothetical protein
MFRNDISKFMLLDNQFILFKVSESIFKPNQRQLISFDFKKDKFKVSKYL